MHGVQGWGGAGIQSGRYQCMVFRAGEELGYKVGDINGDLQDGGFAFLDTTTTAGTVQDSVRVELINSKVSSCLFNCGTCFQGLYAELRAKNSKKIFERKTTHRLQKKIEAKKKV
jgi:hypothetical protein